MNDHDWAERDEAASGGAVRPLCDYWVEGRQAGAHRTNRLAAKCPEPATVLRIDSNGAPWRFCTKHNRAVNRLAGQPATQGGTFDVVDGVHPL